MRQQKAPRRFSTRLASMRPRTTIAIDPDPASGRFVIIPLACRKPQPDARLRDDAPGSVVHDRVRAGRCKNDRRIAATGVCDPPKLVSFTSATPAIRGNGSIASSELTCISAIHVVRSFSSSQRPQLCREAIEIVNFTNACRDWIGVCPFDSWRLYRAGLGGCARKSPKLERCRDRRHYRYDDRLYRPRIGPDGKSVRRHDNPVENNRHASQSELANTSSLRKRLYAACQYDGDGGVAL